MPQSFTDSLRVVETAPIPFQCWIQQPSPSNYEGWPPRNRLQPKPLWMAFDPLSNIQKAWSRTHSHAGKVAVILQYAFLLFVIGINGYQLVSNPFLIFPICLSMLTPHDDDILSKEWEKYLIQLQCCLFMALAMYSSKYGIQIPNLLLFTTVTMTSSAMGIVPFLPEFIMLRSDDEQEEQPYNDRADNCITTSCLALIGVVWWMTPLLILTLALVDIHSLDEVETTGGGGGGAHVRLTTPWDPIRRVGQSWEQTRTFWGKLAVILFYPLVWMRLFISLFQLWEPGDFEWSCIWTSDNLKLLHTLEQKNNATMNNATTPPEKFLETLWTTLLANNNSTTNEEEFLHENDNNYHGTQRSLSTADMFTTFVLQTLIRQSSLLMVGTLLYVERGGIQSHNINFMAVIVIVSFVLLVKLSAEPGFEKLEDDYDKECVRLLISSEALDYLWVVIIMVVSAWMEERYSYYSCKVTPSNDETTNNDDEEEHGELSTSQRRQKTHHNKKHRQHNKHKQKHHNYALPHNNSSFDESAPLVIPGTPRVVYVRDSGKHQNNNGHSNSNCSLPSLLRSRSNSYG